MTKATVLEQAQVLYSKAYVADLKQEFSRAEKIDAEAGDNWHTQRILNRFESRRGCLSNFMQEVKERITHYINKEHKRKGTLWDGRFKSPIVENTPEALLAVSTYIELSPIRAGIVAKPEDYRWSGYAAALGGDQIAQAGIASLYTHRGAKDKVPSWRKERPDYRQYLFEKGLELLEDPDSGMKSRIGFSAEEVEKEIKRRGKLPMRGAEWGNLTTLRDLRLNVIGQPV